MDLGRALDDYSYYCRQKNLSPQTLRWYAQKLAQFRDWLAAERGVTRTEDLRPADVYRFTDALRSGPRLDRFKAGDRSDYTVKGYVQVIKGFLKWAGAEELADDKLAGRIELPRVEQRLIRTLSREQYACLQTAAASEYLPWLMHRDRALLAVLLDTGIRAAELCGLCVPDVHLGGGDPHLVVYGKGRKEREVGPLGAESERLLRRYLQRHRPDATDVPQVFLSKHHTALTVGGLDQALYRLGRWAGEERFAGVRLSAHTFRHTYAVSFLRAGGSIYDLSLLLGHTSVAVTQRYLRDYRSQDARRGRSVLDSWER